MGSVPGAIATGCQLMARLDIDTIFTRSLPLPVLTSFAIIKEQSDVYKQTTIS